MPESTTTYRSRIYERYAAVFQDAAKTFDPVAAARWGRAYDYYLRGWLPRRHDAAMADLACGDGKLLRFFAERGYTNVSGVDISPQQVDLARQVIPQVSQGDVLSFLDAHRDTFDLLVALNVIEHFQKSEVIQFLDGCLLALKSGGRLILQTPNAESPWGAHLRYDDFTHEIAFAPNPISRLLSLCGATDIVCRESGPVPYGYSALSTLRWLAWELIRAGLKLYSLAEMGSVGSGIYTRVFFVSCTKRLAA